MDIDIALERISSQHYRFQVNSCGMLGTSPSPKNLFLCATVSMLLGDTPYIT